jgi:hypothetical protein
MRMAIRGIDVASYQSEKPDLDGMDFCFVKATEGTSYVNPKMRAQADHARAAGRVVGFYHFLRPGSMRAQARYFVDKCASRHGDPLWADWEDSGVSCADKDAFLREVARLRGDTHKVGLYCNTDFWLHRDTTSYCGDALWIAVYNGRPGHPGIRHKWLFHQYTSDPIDTNLGAFASRDALRGWATGGRQEEDDMPQYVSLTRRENFTLEPGREDAVEFTHEYADDRDDHYMPGGSQFIHGPAHYQGTAYLELTGVDPGAEIQVRISEVDRRSHDYVGEGGRGEYRGTKGTTFIAHPFTDTTPHGEGVRLRLKHFSSGPVTVTHVTLKALVWSR